MRLKSVNTLSFGYLDLFGEVKENCSKTDAILLFFFISYSNKIIVPATSIFTFYAFLNLKQ